MTNFDDVKITISDVFEAIYRTNLAGYIFWGGYLSPGPLVMGDPEVNISVICLSNFAGREVFSSPYKLS